MQVNSIGRTSFGVQFSDSFKKALDKTYHIGSNAQKQMYNNYIGAMQVHSPNYKLNVEKDGSITLSNPIGKTINGAIPFEVLKNIHDIVTNVQYGLTPNF